jgi:hypothetical protein
VVGIDKSQALRFFPHDRLSWHANAWPVNTRPPVYRYLVEGVSQGLFTLLPETAIDFARQVKSRLVGASLRQQWQPCVAAWPWYRIVYATLNPNLTKAAAVKVVLDKVDGRRDQLASDFDRLYFVDSKGVWRRP